LLKEGSSSGIGSKDFSGDARSFSRALSHPLAMNFDFKRGAGRRKPQYANFPIAVERSCARSADRSLSGPDTKQTLIYVRRSRCWATADFPISAEKKMPAFTTTFADHRRKVPPERPGGIGELCRGQPSPCGSAIIPASFSATLAPGSRGKSIPVSSRRPWPRRENGAVEWSWRRQTSLALGN
jgi:hypothetical protein